MNIPEICGSKLLYGGFVYYHARTVNSRSYYECNRKGECKARAITFPNAQGGTEIAKGPLPTDPKISNHNHPACPEEVAAEKFKSNLKRKADEHPEVTPAQLLRTELPNLNPGVLARLPSRENIKKTLRRTRRANLPANPNSLEKLGDIPERFAKTVAGERFLVADDNREGSRVITFATRRNLEILAESEKWFVDGTFKVG